MTKLFKHQAINNLLFSAIVLFFYLFFWAIKKYTGLNLIFLPASILLFWLPGKLLLFFFPGITSKFRFWGIFALEFFVSFALITTLQIIFSFLIKKDDFVVETIFLNIFLTLLLLIYFLVSKKNLALNRLHSKYDLKFHKKDLLALLILALIMAAIYYVDPIARDNDGFLNAIKIYTGSLDVIKIRGEFIRYIGLVSIFLNINYILVFRIIFLLFFFVSTFFALDYLKKCRPDLIKYAIFLSFAAAPVILTEVNIIRPQSVLICLTLPVLFLLNKGLEEDNFGFFFIACWFAAITTQFHELGYALLLLCILCFCYFCIETSIFYKKRKIIKNLFLATIIIYPYTELLILHNRFLSQASNTFLRIIYSFRTIKLDLWFIDNYVSMDGKNLGWPGILSLYYYLYNGILFVLLGILAYILLHKKINKKIILIPAFFYLIFYFTIAEILPRLSIYLLLNRAWVHLMLAFYVFIMIFLANIDLKKQVKIISLLLVFVICTGFIGEIYVSKNNMSNFAKEELEISKYISKNTDKKSVILSTQDNDTIVSIYAERNYAQLVLEKDADKEKFIEAVNKRLDELSQPRIVQTVPEVKKVTTTMVNNKIVATEETVNPAREEIFPPIYKERNAPVYFLYSYHKSKGINSQRSYLTESFDLTNKDLYEDAGFPVDKKTDVFILIRIK